MALRERINEEIKTAMKAREQQKLDALRLLLSEVKQQAKSTSASRSTTPA